MRILQVTRESQADRRYGIGRSIASLTAELAALGHKVGYLTLDDLDEEARARLNRRRHLIGRIPPWLAGEGKRVLAGLLAEHLLMGEYAARRAEGEGWTHVHFHNSFIAMGFLRARTQKNIRFGVTQHSFYCTTEAIHRHVTPLSEGIHRLARRLERWTLRRANWVIAPSGTGLARLADDLEEEMIPRHWHALPHPRPELTLPERQAARESLGWREEDIYVLAIGTLIPLKRFPLLIDACGKSRHADRLQVVILGDGDPSSIHQAARDVKLPRQPVVTTTEDVGPWLSAADLYISTTETESFGLANLEALCAGLPSICTAVGAVPDVVGDAALLAPADAEEVAKLIDRTLDEDGLAGQLRQKALARAAAWPDRRATAQKYELIYAASGQTHD